VMSRPPRDPKRPLLTFPLIMRTGLVSLIMVAGGLSVFLWELRIEQAGMVVARTAVINVVVLVQIVYLFNCRSLHHSIFTIGLFTNRWTLVGSLAMLGAQLLFTYVRVMNNLFHSAPLAAESWLRIVGVAAIAFAAVEFEKWIRFGRHRDKNEMPSYCDLR
jgi:cation-transporting ATPase F